MNDILLMSAMGRKRTLQLAVIPAIQDSQRKGDPKREDCNWLPESRHIRRPNLGPIAIIAE
jgi:hypothetical protein